MRTVYAAVACIAVVAGAGDLRAEAIGPGPSDAQALTARPATLPAIGPGASGIGQTPNLSRPALGFEKSSRSGEGARESDPPCPGRAPDRSGRSDLRQPERCAVQMGRPAVRTEPDERQPERGFILHRSIHRSEGAPDGGALHQGPSARPRIPAIRPEDVEFLAAVPERRRLEIQRCMGREKILCGRCRRTTTR